MSAELAKTLLRAKGIESFWRRHGGERKVSTLTALKAEIDRLIRVDLGAATRLADRIEALAQLAGDPVSSGFAAACRARVLHFTGRYADANAKYVTALKALKGAKLKVEAAALQRQQVDALAQMGRYRDALDAAKSARRLLAPGDSLQHAQLETNIGNVYYRLDRYKEAFKHYERAKSLLPARADRTMRALIDFSLSHVFFELDKPEESLALLKSAEREYRKAGQTLFSEQASREIAYIQFLRGNYNTALAGYYQTRDRLKEMGSDQLVAWCDQEIAEILLALNSFDDATDCASSARSRFKKLGMPYESAQALLIKGLAALGQRKFAQSQKDLRQARADFERINNRNLIALTDSYLAELAIRRGDGNTAAKHAAAASKVFRSQKLSTRLANSRLLSARAAYQIGSRSSAISFARSALRGVEGLFAPRIAYQSHHLIGRVHRDSGRHQQALESLRRAVVTVERMRGGVGAEEFKASFLSDKIEVYEDAISACLENGSRKLIDEAFRLVESSKSRALADLLARYVRGGGRGDGGGGAPNAQVRKQLSGLIEKLNWYSSQAGLEDEKHGEQRGAGVAPGYRRAAARCERQIGRLFRRLEAEDSAFAEVQLMRPARSSELRRSLADDETAIEYFATGDQLSAFVASPKGLAVSRAIASNKEVEQTLSALRFHLEKFNYGSAYVDAHFWQLKRNSDEHLAKLYEMVFAPLEAQIKGTRLVIIPHGPLHYAPFQALRDDSGYLIDRFEISYAPSAAVLKLSRQARTGNPGGEMVALGVAENETPGIDDEISALKGIFPGAITFSGSGATRQNLLKYAPRARFLHLASHGYFRRDNPMFSFLKLADSNLNFYSLLDLKLNAELVTLSACHTGVNMVFPGDELHGLMRGFLYVGAPSLLASLWAVGDRSTTEMMSEMYSLINSGVSKRTALRRAQLTVRAQYGHPYYWAPFVLMGNPD